MSDMQVDITKIGKETNLAIIDLLKEFFIETYSCFSLWKKYNQSILNINKFLKAYNIHITPSELLILQSIKNNLLSIQDIAAEINQTKKNVAFSLVALEKRNLITINTPSGKKSDLKIEITITGKKTYQIMQKFLKNLNANDPEIYRINYFSNKKIEVKTS